MPSNAAVAAQMEMQMSRAVCAFLFALVAITQVATAGTILQHKYEHERIFNEASLRCIENRATFTQSYRAFTSTLDNEVERKKMERGENAFIVSPEALLPEFTDPKFRARHLPFYYRMFYFFHYDIDGVIYRVQQLEEKVKRYQEISGKPKKQAFEDILVAFEKAVGFEKVYIEKQCPKGIGATMPAEYFEKALLNRHRSGDYPFCGLLTTAQFNEFVKRGFSFQDMGASLQHGAHSHRLQWYLLAQEFYDFPEEFVPEAKTRFMGQDDINRVILEMYKGLGDEDLLASLDWTWTGIGNYLIDRPEGPSLPAIRRNKNGRDILGDSPGTKDFRRFDLPYLWFTLLDTFRYTSATNTAFFGFSQELGCFRDLPRIGIPHQNGYFYYIRDNHFKRDGTRYYQSGNTTMWMLDAPMIQ